LWFGATLEPVAGHLQVILTRLALDGAGVALHENVAPVPATQIGALLLAKPALVDLCAQRRQNRDEPESGQPLLVEDAEAVRTDVGGEFKRSFDRGCGASPVLLEVGGREVDEDSRLGVEAA